KLFGVRIKINYDYVGANPGFGAGHNRAFAHCNQWADYFLVANPDLEFTPGSLAAGIDFLAAHVAVGLIAPALIEPDGGLRPACFRYPDVPTLLLRALGVDAAHPRIAAYECRDWDPSVPKADPPLISGCCMLFRASTYAQLGRFDPAYFLYFEDFDLSLRAGRLGLSAYCPDMRVRHFGGGVARKGWRHMAHFARSAARFFNIHGWHQ
ncbi:MAG: glycosyltransferase, partial [Azonexus sp.]|nr:glycosyltransferase [Azonexus sp.]